MSDASDGVKTLIPLFVTGAGAAVTENETLLRNKNVQMNRNTV